MIRISIYHGHLNEKPIEAAPDAETTLDQFASENGLEDHEKQAIKSNLLNGKPFHGGGGASPEYTVFLISFTFGELKGHVSSWQRRETREILCEARDIINRIGPIIARAAVAKAEGRS